MSESFKIEWRARFDALEPLAVVAFDGAARRLKARLLALRDEKLGALQGVYGTDLLFVAGAKDVLPWADGVVYLGKDARAGAVFLPTNLVPDVPVDLFEKSLLARFAAQKPFAVAGSRIVPVGKMRPVSRKILSEIL